MNEGRSKYNVDNKKNRRTFQGITFASVLEMRFYKDVVLSLLSSGKIKNAKMQVPFTLQEGFVHEGKKVLPITYVADFVLTLPTGSTVVIDTKGIPDSGAKLKRKLFWKVFPDIPYFWVGYSKADGGWVLWETIQKGKTQRRKERKKKQKEASK